MKTPRRFFIIKSIPESTRKDLEARIDKLRTIKGTEYFIEKLAINHALNVMLKGGYSVTDITTEYQKAIRFREG